MASVVFDTPLASSSRFERWLRRRPLLWIPAVVLVCAVFVGPAGHFAIRNAMPSGGTFSGLNQVLAGLAAAWILACCWWLAIATRAFLPVTTHQARWSAAIVVLIGSGAWLMPSSLTLPSAGRSAVATAADWVLESVPYLLVAVAVYPAMRSGYRLIAIVALVGLSAAWPALADSQIRHAVSAERAAIGAPPGMDLLINLSGYDPDMTYSNGYVQVAYSSPDDSPVDGSPDLVMKVCAPGSEQFCLSGLDGAAGDTTLQEQHLGYVVSLTVDPTSDSPVAAGSLHGLLATVHPATDSEILSMAG